MAKANLFLKFVPQYFDFLAGFRPEQQDNFRDLVNYPVPCKRSGYLEQFWTALVSTLGNGSNQIPKWTGPKVIRSRVNGALKSIA